MEKRSDDEAMQASASHQGIFESQGARPKINHQAVNYAIDFLETIKPVQSQPANLQISLENGLIFDKGFEANIGLKDFRLVSKFQHLVDKQSIHISFYNTEQDCISSVFFEVDDLEACFVDIQNLYQYKLISQCNPLEMLTETELSRAVEFLKQQPIYLGWVRSAVQEKAVGDETKLDAPPHDTQEYLLIVDLECISWYESQTVKPTYQMTFWADNTPKSVETVRHHQTNKFILFETKSRAISIDSQMEIVQNLRLLRPKKVNFLKDTQAFVAILPNIRREIPYTAPQASTSGDFPRSYYRDTSRYEDKPGRAEVDAFRAELQSALDQFAMNDVCRLMWIPIEHDLQELADAGHVPVVDALSGGLDPDNAEHFIKGLKDIEDYLLENNYATVLGRLAAVREVFKESKLHPITDFLREFTDIEFLKRLYFWGLVK